MKEIIVQETGQGDPLLLIHGFPMNASAWDDLSAHLTDSFNVITPDLPGFGKSPLPEEPFSIDRIADTVLMWLKDRKLENVVAIGHSLGGYIVLAMLAKRPEWFAGAGLFHSTAYADSAEKKESRNKVIEFVKKNGAEAFTTSFVTPLFSHPSHPAIPRIQRINKEASAGAIIGYAQAMRDRPDRAQVLRDFKRPFLFIAGELDPGIPVASIEEQAKLAAQAEVAELKGQAHMGLIEEADKTAAIIRKFVERCHQ